MARRRPGDLLDMEIIGQVIIRVIDRVVVFDDLGIFVGSKAVGAAGVNDHPHACAHLDFAPVPGFQIYILQPEAAADDVEPLCLL